MIIKTKKGKTMTFGTNQVKKEYCKVCGEPLFWESPDGNMLVRAICSCEEKELEKLKKEKQNKIFYKKYTALLSLDIRGDKFKSVYLKDFNCQNDKLKEVYTAIKNYIQDISKGKTKSIYIYGNAGVGKSMLSAIIVNHLLNNQVPAIMTNFIEIKNKLFTGNGETIKTLLKTVNVLVIDDIGVEYIKDSNNSFTQELIYEIINYRYINNKSTVFSSNYSLVELNEDKDIAKRTVQRISEMCGKSNVHKIAEESYRKKIFNKK